MSPPEPRLLFIVSADYGELSNALYFLRGGGFAARLLLPERLYTANRDSLPVPAERYATAPDILAAAAHEPPDIVFLFSGYLLAFNGILDLPSVRELMRQLRKRGAELVVTDPFLGLLRPVCPSPFNARHPAKLDAHFAQVAQLMDAATHLYLVAPDGEPAPRAASFSNPVLWSEVRTSGAGPLQWLFVLAAEDAGAQAHRLGQERFVQLLRARLADAVRAGRRPVLVAPQPLLDVLAGTVDGLIALSFCAHATFTRLLLEAEYAFYWNPFSNSVPARLVNGRAAFFFDRGHMAHAIPALYELGLRTYYPGTRPSMLALDAALVPGELADLASSQAAGLQQARLRFTSAPTPRELVQRLLTGRTQ
jgi:hypothetical protein